MYKIGDQVVVKCILEKFTKDCDQLWKDGWNYEIGYEKYYEEVRVPFLLKWKIKRLIGKNHSLIKN